MAEVQYLPIRKIPYEERIQDAPKNARKTYREFRKKGYSKNEAKFHTKLIIKVLVETK